MRFIVLILLLLLLFLSPEICSGGEINLSQSFINYIRSCENGIKKGWDSKSQKWFPYDDGSGLHIAYGHKINKGENFDSGISEAQAQEILKKDLQEAYKKAKDYFKERGFDITDFSDRQLEMTLDFTFNGCLYSHTKMMNAIANSDLETQRKEYKRYAVLNGNKVELRDRNTRFFNRYLKSN
jgi:hypothetical protein